MALGLDVDERLRKNEREERYCERKQNDGKKRKEKKENNGKTYMGKQKEQLCEK